MNLKWIGAVLVVSGCGGFGFSLAAGYRKQEQMLRQLIFALNRMEWELKYRLTSLPELCRMASESVKSPLCGVFTDLAQALEMCEAPDAAMCMADILERRTDLPNSIRMILREMGTSLGHFDLPGQVKGLEAAENACQRELEKLEENRDSRLRSYEALGVCAGAALAILFL